MSELKMTITDAGIALLQKAQANECKIIFTHGVSGSGTWTEDELTGATALKEQKQTFAINSGAVKVKNDHTVIVGFTINNADLAADYSLKEMGIYAGENDGSNGVIGGTEILYAIAMENSTPSNISKFDGSTVQTYTYNFIITVDHASEITCTINIDEYATKTELATETQRAQEQEKAITTRSKTSYEVSLPTDGWTTGAPYRQTAIVSGITEDDVPVASVLITSDDTRDTEKAKRKAASCISYFETYDGSITFTCLSKRPETDFSLLVKP